MAKRLKRHSERPGLEEPPSQKRGYLTLRSVIGGGAALFLLILTLRLGIIQYVANHSQSVALYPINILAIAIVSVFGVLLAIYVSKYRAELKQNKIAQKLITIEKDFFERIKNDAVSLLKEGHKALTKFEAMRTGPPSQDKLVEVTLHHKAEELIKDIVMNLCTALVVQAKTLAYYQGHELVSKTHVQEARDILQRLGKESLWRNWLSTFGGVFFGTSVPGFINDLSTGTHQKRLAFYVCLGFVGFILIILGHIGHRR